MIDLAAQIEAHLKAMLRDIVEHGQDATTEDYIILLQAVRQWFDIAIDDIIKEEQTHNIKRMN
jgi:hypothetical protein